MNTRIFLSIRLVLLLCTAFCASLTAFAQSSGVKLSLTMSSRPSPYISDWSSKKETIILTVTNTSATTLSGRFDGEVTRDGTLAAQTKFAQMPIVSIPPGVSTFFADEVLPESAVKIYGNAQQTAIRTGMLPAGSYQLCVNLVDANDQSKKLATTPSCRGFNLTSYQPVQLTLPADKAEIKKIPAPTFHWVPVVPTPQGKVRYRVMVFEVLRGQTPMQAFKSNHPIVDRDALVSNQMIWPADVQFPGTTTQFVWSVRAFDANNQPIGEPDGFAAPFTFTITGTSGHDGGPITNGGHTTTNDTSTTHNTGTGSGTLNPGGGVIVIAYPTFTDPYQFTPKKDLPFSGVVRDAITDKPIANATVEFHTAKQQMYGFKEDAPKQITKTDANGAFKFAAVKAPTFFSIRVTAESYTSVYEIGPGQKMEAAITNYVVLMKPRRLHITGTIADNVTKKGVPNAVVELWKRPTHWCDVCPATPNWPDFGWGIGGSGRSNPRGMQPQNQLVKSVKTYDAGSTTDTANPYRSGGSGIGGGLIIAIQQDGTFVLPDIPYWDNYYLKIKHPRYEADEVVHIPVGTKDTIYLGKILIKGNRGTINVTVLDKKTKKPIPGATVRVFPDVGSPAASIPSGSVPALPANGQWSPGMGSIGVRADNIGIANAGLRNGSYIPRSSGGMSIDTSKMSSGGAGDVYTSGSWYEVATGWGVPYTMGTPTPEKMPDIPSLYSATTGINGTVSIPNVIVNDPDQSTDRYAVWVRTPLYGDAWKPARLTKNGQVISLTIYQDSAKGFIEGLVRDKNSTLPLGNCKVELVNKVMGSEKVIKTVFTNADGTYTIYPVQVGTYTKIAFSKDGYAPQTKEGPIKIEAGTAINASTEMIGYTGNILVKAIEIKGKDTAYLANVFVHSPNVPNLTGVTAITGTTLISGLPVDTTILVVSLPQYADQTAKVVVKKDQTITVLFKLTKPKSSINVIVTDSITHTPLPNAIVKVGGVTQKTDLGGLASFQNTLPIGTADVVVVPDTAGATDYKPFTSKVILNEGLNEPVNVKLKPGARISGKVVAVNGNTPLDSVTISATGVAGASTKTGPDGTFVLRNVPAGVALTINASKSKYMLGKASLLPLQVGQQKTGVDFSLADAPIDSVYGFAVILDTITDGPGGNKYLKGRFKVPDNMFFAVDPEAKFTFPFENLEVDPVKFKPVAVSHYFTYDQIPIKLFGAVEATMSAEGDFLKVTWDSVNNTGAIRANKVALKGFIPNLIPGAQWGAEKLSTLGNKADAIGFWADGSFHGGSFLKLDSSQAEVNFWGFKLKVDYKQTTMKDDGFHYVGSLTIPKINKTIAITDLFFKKIGTGADTHLEFEHVKLANQPPLEINLWAFKFIDSTLTWNQQGLVASGSVVLTKLSNRTFRFDNMMISKEGKFMGVKITADNSNLPIEVLGSKFYITGLGFATQAEVKDNNGQITTPETHLFTFSGNLQIPQFSKKIEFQNLTFSDQGDFTGTIAFNQSVKFFNTISLELQSIEFGKEKPPGGVERKFIFVKGGVAFSIPLLSVQVGNFRFFEDKTFAVEKIGFAFNAGPVNVSLSAQWNDSSFSGTGLLAVQPVFSVGGEFYYKDGNNWKIKIAANIPPIPIGPVAITGVSGMLARNNGYWAFGFGGSVATAAGKDAMELTIQVAVETSPQGPVIQGDAWLKTMDMQIGEAHLTIDIPQQRFSGSVEFGFDKKAVKIVGFVNFEIKSGQYWFVGGGATFDFIKVMQVNTDIYVGKNYPGFAHAFPVMYHPDNQPLNGVHFDASTVWPKIGKDGDMFHLEFGYYLFGAFNWNGDLAAGLKMKGNAAIDIWIAGLNISVEAQAAIQYKNGTLEFHANADLKGTAWVYPCDSKSACDSWCMFCPCIHFVADYSGKTGWDVDFSLGCD